MLFFFFFAYFIKSSQSLLVWESAPFIRWIVMDCFLSSPRLLFFTRRGSPRYSLSEHFGSYSPSRSSEIHSRVTQSQRSWDFPLCVTQRYNLVICVSLLRKLKVFQRVTLEMWTPLQMMLFLLHCTSLHSAICCIFGDSLLFLSVSLSLLPFLYTHTSVEYTFFLSDTIFAWQMIK